MILSPIRKRGLITEEWNSYLHCFEDGADIYFTEEYVKLYETENDRAECFVYEEDGKVFIMPYLKRRVDLLEGGYFDFETAYGYGGPLSNTPDGFFVERAVDAFFHLASESGMVAGFVRFHPLLSNHAAFAKKGRIWLNRKTVAMDLGQEIEGIWNDIHSKHRNSIRKAERAGLLYRVDEGLDGLKDFVEIYGKTMQIVKADEYYLFGETYFERLRDLKEHCFLGLITLGDKIISGALFFRCGDRGHYHLSGSLSEYRGYNPNSLLLYKTALYMKERGVIVFHLGGGVDGNSENSLYRFKRRFSRSDLPFYTGSLVFDEDKYNKVCDIWEKQFPEKKEKYGNFILKYRY